MKAILKLLALLIWVNTALAAPPVPAYTMSNATTASVYSATTFGSKFTVVSPCQVEKLGVYDHDQDGLLGTVPVGIWDSTGTLLAQTTVLPSDPLTGVFRFHALSSPVALAFGQTYYIGALANNLDETAEDAPSFVSDPLITFVSAQFIESPTLSRPTVDGGEEPRFFGANMIVSALPYNPASEITLSASSLDENNAPGATVGTLAASGFNMRLAQTFSLVSGAGSTDNSAFTITGGALTINASADYETKSSYSIRVRSTDNADSLLTFEKQFTITVVDVNLPQVISFDPLPGKTFGNAPFTVSAIGGGSAQPVIFSVTSGPATISGNTVTLTGSGTVTITATQAAMGDYAAAAPVARTFFVSKASQTISFTNPGPRTFGDAPFALSATGGGSGNPVTFTITAGSGTVATLGGNTITIVGVGSVTVRASQSGNADYNAALSVSQSFVVGKASQTISFTSPGPKTFGDAPFALVATGGASGNPVTFSVFSGPATVSGNTLTITGAGSVTVRASQAGNANYNAAADADQTFSVAKAAQAITFGALPDKVFGDAPFVVSATGGASGNPVTFTATGNATVSGDTVTITGAGSATITAHQASSANYEAAPDVARTFTIGKAAQVISFGPLANKVFGDAPFTVSATGGASGMPVTFTATGDATVLGSTVTITGAGSATITAHQAGSANYNPATDVAQTFTIGKADQVITFGALGAWVFGDEPFMVTATGGMSGNPVTFTASGSVSVSGNIVTINGAGGATITAHQAGSANYNAAPDVSQSLTIAKASQEITFAPLADKVFGDAPFVVSATGGASGNAVTFTASGNATVSGSTVTITGAGSATITAHQAGSANYEAAGDVSRTFSIGKAAQGITFAPLADKVFGDAPFMVSATGGMSGNAVTFTASGNATVSGNTVTITGAGSATITAHQAGSADYEAAPDVARTFTIGKADQVITFGPLGAKVFGDAPFTVSASGGASGMPVTFTATGDATVSGNTVTITGAGSATITAHQAGNANYNPATDVAQTFAIGKADQVITFGPLGAKVFGDAPFTVSATGGASGNAVTFTASGNATVSGSTVTITGAGSATITAHQTGSANYNAATDVSQSFTIGKAAQEITFGPLGAKVFGDAPFTVSATGGASGNAVTFTASGNATVSGNTVTITGAGSATITAHQAGSANYDAAPDASQTFTIGKASQVISFGPLGPKTVGDAPFTVSATGGASGMPVTFTASGAASVIGNTVTILGAGSATITAHQAGSANYEAAADVARTFTVGKAAQEITFAPLADKVFGDAPFAVSATGGASGNPVTFTATGNATVTGNMVTITGAGSATITAHQAGSVDYEAAPDVARTFTIGKADQVITFGPLGAKVFGDVPFTVSATGGASGMPVTFTATGNATVSGNTVTITGAGSATITAHQAGSANYNPATSVDQTFTIGKADQVITFAPLGAKVFGDAPFSVSATGGASGMPVTFTATGAATVSGSTVTITGAGSATITAHQAGSADYNAAADVAQSFTIGKADQVITFGALGAKVFGDAPFTVSATGGASGEPVTFTATGDATVSGNTVTITGAGSATITAHQAGSASYNAAADVAQTFSIAKAAQEITFGPLGAKVFGDLPFTVSATGGASGEPVTFTATGDATVSGNTVTITGAGSATITAHQAGSANYDAAADVAQSFTIAKADQVITFGPLPAKTFGDAPFTISATGGGSGNAVTFTATGDATVSGSTVTITAAGSATITAHQAGSANYNAAADVAQTLTIGKAPQEITFTNPGAHAFGDAPFALVATGGGSMEPVTFAVIDGPATVSGNMLTLTGAGSVTVRASQAGNANYLAAADVDQTFSAGLASQVISFTNPGPKTFGDAPFALLATGGASGEPVTFSVTAGPATVAGNMLTLTGAGSVTVRASQAGNVNYAPAADVDQTFSVATAAQVITFGPLADKSFGDAPFTVSATGGASGEPVTFTASGAATISGNTVTITGLGLVTITAHQAGSGDYAAAADVAQSFTVGQGAQVITFTPPATAGSGDTVILSATGGASGNPVTFSLVSGPGALTGNSLIFSGTGTVVVRASQAGNANYLAAADVDGSISILLNTAPVGVDDAVTITTGDATLYPLANDTDADGSVLSITAVSEPTVTIDGRALVVPAGYTGTFTYTLYDGISTATANVVVTAGSAVSGATRYSGLLYSSTGTLVGRGSLLRSAGGVNTISLRVGATTGSNVFAFPATGNSVTGRGTALGPVNITLDANDRVVVTLPGGVSGNFRPSIASPTQTLYHVGLGSLDPALTGGAFGRVRVNATGSVTLSLRMPDGRKFSGGASMSDNGSINFYGPQAATVPTGFVGGELITAGLTKTDITGEIEWKRPVQATGMNRPAVNTVVVVNGCEYLGSFGFPDGPARVIISGGSFVTPVTINTTSFGSVIAPQLPTLRRWSVQSGAQTFLARILTPSSFVPVSAIGIYFPKSQTAIGYFPGSTKAGKIELSVP